MTASFAESQPVDSSIEESAEKYLAPYEKIDVQETGIVLLGASGVGKSTLRDRLCSASVEGTEYVKHMRLTTRPPRPAEEPEYYHVTPGVMDALRGDPRVLLNSELYGNEYTTMWPQKLQGSSKYIFIFRPPAALELRKTFPNLKFIHILPENLSVLSHRISSRNPNISTEELQIRLSEIESEIARSNEIADATVVNYGTLEHVAANLKQTMDELTRQS